MMSFSKRLAFWICPALRFELEMAGRVSDSSQRIVPKPRVATLTEADIVDLIKALAAAKGWKPNHAARMVSGSGDTITRLEAGIGLTLRRANKIIRRTHELWPEGRTEWPSDIPRPSAPLQGLKHPI